MGKSANWIDLERALAIDLKSYITRRVAPIGCGGGIDYLSDHGFMDRALADMTGLGITDGVRILDKKGYREYVFRRAKAMIYETY